MGSQSIAKKESEVAQSCPCLCYHMDCSLPGPSVHGIFQARVLEWAAISFAKGYSQPRDWTQVSHIADFTIWATKEIQKSVGKYRETKHIRRGNDKLYMSMENSITVFPIKNTSPTIRTRPSFPPQSVSPIRKLPKSSYPYLSEGKQNEKHNQT